MLLNSVAKRMKLTQMSFRQTNDADSVRYLDGPVELQEGKVELVLVWVEVGMRDDLHNIESVFPIALANVVLANQNLEKIIR